MPECFISSHFPLWSPGTLFSSHSPLITGFERAKELAQFLSLASGSLAELETQLLLSVDLG